MKAESIKVIDRLKIYLKKLDKKNKKHFLYCIKFIPKGNISEIK